MAFEWRKAEPTQPRCTFCKEAKAAVAQFGILAICAPCAKEALRVLGCFDETLKGGPDGSPPR